MGSPISTGMRALWVMTFTLCGRLTQHVGDVPALLIAHQQPPQALADGRRWPSKARAEATSGVPSAPSPSIPTSASAQFRMGSILSRASADWDLRWSNACGPVMLSGDVRRDDPSLPVPPSDAHG